MAMNPDALSAALSAALGDATQGVTVALGQVTAADLLAEADQAMYRAKQRGGAQFVLSDRGFGSLTGERGNA